MTDFIGIYEKFASVDYCERMIARLEDLVAESSGCLGQEANGGLENRKDVSRYFETDDKNLAVETNKILDEVLRKYMDEHPALGMRQFYSQSVKVQKTPPKGGFHLWHAEQGLGHNASRCLVWMIYLSDTPEGEGTTEFLEQGLKVQPKQGTVVFFPAAWTHTHRGNPVYTCDKYIATGWYYLA